MSVKRYRATSDWEEWPDGAFVLATDYDAAVAVLRRCVRVMERHAGSAACLLWTRDKENDAALAAAREYTEGEKK